jgi:hypothetical protein
MTFGSDQRRTRGTQKLEFLSLALPVVRQQG